LLPAELVEGEHCLDYKNFRHECHHAVGCNKDSEKDPAT